MCVIFESLDRSLMTDAFFFPRYHAAICQIKHVNELCIQIRRRFECVICHRVKYHAVLWVMQHGYFQWGGVGNYIL